MDDLKRLKYFRNYFKIAVLTLVFFLTSFGPAFFKELTHREESRSALSSHGDGLTNSIFSIPLALTIALLLISVNALYLSKEKAVKSNVGFILASLLAIPVAVFGFLMFFASIVHLVKLIGHFLRSVMNL